MADTSSHSRRSSSPEEAAEDVVMDAQRAKDSQSESLVRRGTMEVSRPTRDNHQVEFKETGFTVPRLEGIQAAQHAGANSGARQHIGDVYNVSNYYAPSSEARKSRPGEDIFSWGADDDEDDPSWSIMESRAMYQANREASFDVNGNDRKV